MWQDRLYNFPVQWDWSAADSINWNQPGKNYIYGSFSDESMADCVPKLDFDHMPELVLTISIEVPLFFYHLSSEEEKLYDDNTVHFQFLDDYGDPLSFENTLDLTLWCSTDNMENWYNITMCSNVILKTILCPYHF